MSPGRAANIELH